MAKGVLRSNSIIMIMLTVESQILGHRHANSKSGRNCDVLFVRLVNIENADLVLLISGLYSEVTAK